MITDAEIRTKGLKALITALGAKETERFLQLLDRQPGDYTEWRHLLFEGMSAEEIHDEADSLWRRSQEDGLSS